MSDDQKPFAFASSTLLLPTNRRADGFHGAMKLREMKITMTKRDYSMEVLLKPSPGLMEAIFVLALYCSVRVHSIFRRPKIIVLSGFDEAKKKIRVLEELCRVTFVAAAQVRKWARRHAKLYH